MNGTVGVWRGNTLCLQIVDGVHIVLETKLIGAVHGNQEYHVCAYNHGMGIMCSSIHLSWRPKYVNLSKKLSVIPVTNSMFTSV